METNKRKRQNTAVDNSPLLTFVESDPLLKDLKDRWAGMTDEQIKKACEDE